MSNVEELQAILPQLPEELVDDLLRQARAWQDSAGEKPPFVPVKLGGLLEGVVITDEDIREMRREAWAGFGDERNLE